MTTQAHANTFTALAACFSADLATFIQCASDAWSETVDLAQRMTAGV
ncbi:hypothetical protein [Streptomyces sp. NPDC059008]